MFQIGDIISIEYDELNPERYEPGIFKGIVVKIDGERMKIVYAYGTGETDICWLAWSHAKVESRWIDKTFSAFVHVEVANTAEIEDFCRLVPLGRQNLFLKREQET